MAPRPGSRAYHRPNTPQGGFAAGVGFARAGTRTLSDSHLTQASLMVARSASRTRLGQRRRAPTYVAAYQESDRLEILTTSPVWGEWMNFPPPM